MQTKAEAYKKRSPLPTHSLKRSKLHTDIHTTCELFDLFL